MRDLMAGLWGLAVALFLLWCLVSVWAGLFVLLGWR